MRSPSRTPEMLILTIKMAIEAMDIDKKSVEALREFLRSIHRDTERCIAANQW